MRAISSIYCRYGKGVLQSPPAISGNPTFWNGLSSRSVHNTGMDRSYDSAVKILETQRVRRGIPSGYTEDGHNITDMQRRLQLLGHSAASINELNVILVNGSKGKTCSCAFIEALLRANSQRTGVPRKIGFFAITHVHFLTERIRINSKPLDQTSFAKTSSKFTTRLRAPNSISQS